jgi:hypothetical protein
MNFRPERSQSGFDLFYAREKRVPTQGLKGQSEISWRILRGLPSSDPC